jgi:hypothetical protein
MIPMAAPKSNRIDPWEHDTQRSGMAFLQMKGKGFCRIFSGREKIDVAVFLVFINVVLIVGPFRSS